MKSKKGFDFKFPFPKIVTTSQLLVVALIIASFFVGSLSAKVQYLESGTIVKGEKTTDTAQAGSADPQVAPPSNTGPVKVSIDDDAVMGDENAPITLIEFSDYECPFCKRSFEDVLPQLKEEYIDTGKVKFVYRDLPLGFHQNAHIQAQAAECARDQGDDSTYFLYHDEIFKRTESNGTGLAVDELPVIASDLGLDVATFQSCLDSEKFKEEVDKDIADSNAAGADGTPSWFIGKTTSSGEIDGTLIVGAQPYTAFKTVIDQQLEE